MKKIYPRSGDTQIVYLNAVVKDPAISVGDYTIYNDFVEDPRLFEKNNVLYHYPIHAEKLIIGKFCSIACGTKFLFNCANHSLKSLSTYTFPLFCEEWGLDERDMQVAWDNKGDIVMVMMSGLVTKLSFWLEYTLVMGRSLGRGLLLQKMFLLIRL